MTEEDDRISDIINRLEDLSVESRTLTQELRQLNLVRSARGETPPTAPRVARGTPTLVEPQAPFEHQFEIGDQVKITNRYRKQFGIVGKVTHVTTTQVTITDASGQTYRRHHSNVKTIVG
jgi:hypothetical protein